MSFRLNYTDIHPQSPCYRPKNILILHRTSQIRESRVWRRRRRLKTNPIFTLRNQLGPLISHSFENLISQFPSVNSLDLIAPALGFASGVALYISRFKYNSKKSQVSDIGEWILFTSPTPFNRFVLLRCPSISFELEDVNEKLVLNRGRILDGGNSVFEGKFVYQRVCVSTDDGGVISLDWPANLDLTEEHGMDTTLLLVPGTAEGSMDKNIRSFVCESLKHGCFPVVMNPRGCAGSPLTTARLFTAADSDDISTAIQFINRARPWTTLMCVGWGYGANMLTKYLAEVGERTPLTAATCIDNPFDLEEATRSSHYHISVDQKLRGGLIDILRSNKELFQGRTKGFNVEKALSATSVRDFEKAISMVSYGFEAIEEFYSKSSTRELVGNVKIPVLFIQSDNGTVPLFSIPRSLIAENPFTSLLLCSCLPSSIITSDRSAIYWCQHLAIEWFTAVELGLLKGRHPLLKDVDVTINPSKGLALVESRPSDEQSSVNNLLNLTLSDAIKGYSVDPIKEMLEDHDTAPSVRLRSGRDSQMKRNFELEGVGLHQEENSGVLQQTNSVDAEPVEEAGDNPADSERGEVLQTAQVVMNMLDITMPGTLAEEHKKKVLTAVEQGETLMKALQEAVPEDVRGKLRAAVSGIVQTQGTNLNLDGLLRIGQIPNVSSELKSKIQEKIGLSSAEGEYKEHHSSDQTRSADEPSNSTDNNQPSMERPAGGLESELQPSQNLQKSVDLGHSQSESSHEGDLLCSGGKDTNESERSHEIDEFSKERAAQYSDYSEPGSETGGRPNPHVRSEKASETEEAVGELDKVNQDSDIAQEKVKEGNNIQNKEEKSLDASTDQNKLIPPTKTEETVSPISLSEATPSSTKSEEPSLSILPDSNPPSFNVSQALDALTGMDDSTQMAVNSFFGVIENMITQLEEDKDNGNDGEQDKNAHNDKESGSASEGPPIIGENKFEKIEDNKNDLGVQSDLLQSYNYPVNNCHEKSTESHQDAANGWEKKPTQSLTSSFSSSFYSSQEANTSNHVDKENDEKRKEHLTGSSFLAASSDKLRHVNKIPLYITINPYGDSMYNEYLRNLLLKLQNTKSLDLDTTTALFLDYFPEEGQWKLLDQPGNTKDSIDDIVTCEGVNGTVQTSPEKANETEKIIEPSYVILDVEEQQKAVGDYETADSMNDKSDICSDRSDELMYLIKNIILDSLKVEVGRRLGQPGMQEMESNVAQDLEQVSDAVSMAVGRMEHTCCLESKYPVSEKVGTLPAEHIIRAISSAVQDAGYLRKILPVGVIVGSSLAGLRKYFSVAMLHDNGQNEAATLGQADNVMEKFYGKGGKMGNDHEQFDKNDQNSVLDSSIIRDEKIESKDLINDTVMVSAVTAALGASALLVRQQRKAPYRRDVTAEVSSKSLNMKGNHQKELYKHDEAISEQNQNNGVTSLAEKAMSVAGPVVPTKSDGEVDQDRLVAMLADWGQKGGMLRLIGKVALLWGGIRGAMSLTDKLILFLRIAERPLFQRILGFVCMVLVLWSPVVVPLFPTLVQSWATHNSSRIAEFACVIGLYTAVMILVKIWGKRIRGYENPFEQYGLDLTSSPKLRDFLKGLIGGVMLILSIHSINALLGYACLSWPLGLPSSSLDAKILLKVYGRMLILAGQGIVTATGVAIVEELLYRSWLPEEIAVDLGYHRGFIISGLAFSIFQRSPHAIPGLWLLSLGLAGARQRSDGSLSLPIGMRAGIMASSFILEMGGFLTYRSHSPLWLTGAHPFQPFGGVVGLAFSFLLALVLYPRQPLLRKRIERTIRE